jgi:hypothetical protein
MLKHQLSRALLVVRRKWVYLVAAMVAARVAALKVATRVASLKVAALVAALMAAALVASALVILKPIQIAMLRALFQSH